MCHPVWDSFPYLSSQPTPRQLAILTFFLWKFTLWKCLALPIGKIHLVSFSPADSYAFCYHSFSLIFHSCTKWKLHAYSCSFLIHYPSYAPSFSSVGFFLHYVCTLPAGSATEWSWHLSRAGISQGPASAFCTSSLHWEINYLVSYIITL